EDLTGHGIQLWIEKGQLHYRAPKGTLHPTMLKLLAENKAEIRAYLSARQRAEASDLFAQVEPDYAHRYQPFPLTDLQMAYWAGRGATLKIGNVGDHTYIEQDTIVLDLQRFEIALQRLIERHEMLRVVILPDGQQQILEHVSLPPLRVIDLRGLDSQPKADQLAQTRQEMEHQLLPVEHWPPFDLRVTLLDAQRSRVHLSIETLFVDATSFSILAHEFLQFYSNPETTLEPLNFSFRDYTLAIQEKFRRSERYQSSRAYWLKRLPDLPPAPNFPLVHLSNMPVQPRFVPRQAKLSAREWKRLKTRAALSGVTPASVLLTAFAEVLTSWSKSPRFSINLHVCNREAFHPQVDAVVGNFTSLTVLAIDHSVPETFEKRVQHIQKELVDTLEYRHYSSIHVLREWARHRGEGAKVVLPVMFRSTLLQSDTDFYVASDSFQELTYYNTQTFQVLLDHHVFEVNGELIFHWSVVEEAFPSNFVDAMFDAYCRLLQHLAVTEVIWQELSYEFLGREEILASESETTVI
ncbi:MAG TPA: condensation domain-containing protein, partial [Ktedonobacteraceae bacterium]